MAMLFEQRAQGLSGKGRQWWLDGRDGEIGASKSGALARRLLKSTLTPFAEQGMGAARQGLVWLRLQGRIPRHRGKLQHYLCLAIS